MHDTIAIIGMGARFPGSVDLPAFRRTIWAGAVHNSEVPAMRWDHAVVHSANPRHSNKTPAGKAAFVDGVDQFAPEFFGITPKRARVMDPQQRVLLEVVRQTLEDAGYARRELAGGKVGVYVGTNSADQRTYAFSAVTSALEMAGRVGSAPALTPEAVAAISQALPPVQAYSIVGAQLNMTAANVSQAFDFSGPSFAIDTACSSALAALHEGIAHLRMGLVDAALVAGSHIILDPSMMVCFSRIGAISFTDKCRPFQADADGFVLGEGAGAIVLKRLADAQRDGDRVVAVIRGIAMNNDGRGAGPLTPRASGQSAVIAAAWRDAGLDPLTAGLVEAHATGTQAGDAIELVALKEIFARRAAPLPISSVKANIGHGLASSGMASLLKAVFAVEEGKIPPQPVAGPLRAEFAAEAAWLRLSTQAAVWPAQDETPRRAGISAFGFGGTNVHVVIEQAPSANQTREPAPVGGWRFEFSAPTTELLATYVGAIEAALRANPLAPEDVAFTLAQRRVDRVRAVLAAGSETELLAKLGALRVALARGEAPAPTQEGAIAGGRLVSLPPSLLAQRRFWLIDELKTRRVTMPALAAPTETTAATVAGIDGEKLKLVVDAITAVTARPAGEIRLDHRFAHDLGFDSLTTLEFITTLGRSLPGMPALPRTLFTPALTVAELVDYLGQAGRVKISAPSVVLPVMTFQESEHPWLREHRPGGEALLPMAALVQAAMTALRPPQGRPPVLADFKVLGPIEVRADRLAIATEKADDGTFTLRAEPGGAVLASGTVRPPSVALPLLPEAVENAGRLSLANFYAKVGFHGPALQALSEVPVVGLSTAMGWLRGGHDEVKILDGALQLALYWLGATRQQTAVATGFAELRLLAAWPDDGVLRCVCRLTGETAARLIGDFDFLDANGGLVAQWRGVEAQVIAGDLAEKLSGGVADFPEVRELAERKAALAAAGFAMPYFAEHDGIASATTHIGGREYLNFSSYNYLGFAGDATVGRAASDAIARYGTSSSASRVASGERPLHGELERALAQFLGCEDAITLVSGHATNVALIGHLLGPEDLVIHDSLAHDCIVTGARLSGARRLVFPHNDTAALAALLERERPRARRALIAIEGVYSMDGDLGPLAAVVELKRRHDALLLVDEAHSLGVLGSTGRGVGEHFAVARGDVDFWMGTLSKSLASCGGYIAGTAVLVDYLRFTLPGFVYSVGISPANAAAALAALRLLAAHPELPRRLQERSDYFRALCRARGVDIGASAHAAVVPCITGTTDRALGLAQALGARGINVQPIFHPAVEEGRARLRFFITAEHTEEQLRLTADALAEEMAAWEDRRKPA